MKMFFRFPREMFACGIRTIVNNKKEFMDFVNTYNKRDNVHTSVYSFSEIEDGEYRKIPVKESADVDKIFFDFDGDDSFEDALKLHNFFLRRDLMHTALFSGRGFHLYLFVDSSGVEHKSDAVANVQIWVKENLNVDIDSHVIGDLSRLSRVPYTFNVTRNRYCIMMNDDLFKLNRDEIRKIAKNRVVEKMQVWGSKMLNLSKYDRKVKKDFGIDIIIEDENESVYLDDLNTDNFPYCIRILLSNKNLDYNARTVLVTFFKEMGYDMNETKEILQQTLSESKFYHMIETGQIPLTYRNNYRISNRIKVGIERTGLCNRCKNICSMEDFYV